MPLFQSSQGSVTVVADLLTRAGPSEHSTNAQGSSVHGKFCVQSCSQPAASGWQFAWPQSCQVPSTHASVHVSGPMQHLLEGLFAPKPPAACLRHTPCTAASIGVHLAAPTSSGAGGTSSTNAPAIAVHGSSPSSASVHGGIGGGRGGGSLAHKWNMRACLVCTSQGSTNIHSPTCKDSSELGPMHTCAGCHRSFHADCMQHCMQAQGGAHAGPRANRGIIHNIIKKEKTRTSSLSSELAAAGGLLASGSWEHAYSQTSSGGVSMSLLESMLPLPPAKASDAGRSGSDARAWYHCQSCQDVRSAMAVQARKGFVPLPSHSIQHLPDEMNSGSASGTSESVGAPAGVPVTTTHTGCACKAEGDAQAQGAANSVLASTTRRACLVDVRSASATAKIVLSQAAALLCTEFGYHTSEVKRYFDYAFLVKQGSRPVCAGVLDVYGTHAAELVLLSTPGHARRQGHARAAVQQLAGWLADAGVARLLVCVDDDDMLALDFWHATKLPCKPAACPQGSTYSPSRTYSDTYASNSDSKGSKSVISSGQHDSRAHDDALQQQQQQLWQSAQPLGGHELSWLGRVWPQFSADAVGSSVMLCYNLTGRAP